jgi:hypothetical protein
VQIDGMNVGSAFNGGGVSGYGYDTANAQEVQLTVAGGLGEADRGGPQFNIIPKTGGNSFSGTYFGSLAGKWSQGNNVDDQLRSFGIPEPTTIIRNGTPAWQSVARSRAIGSGSTASPGRAASTTTLPDALAT